MHTGCGLSEALLEQITFFADGPLHVRTCSIAGCSVLLARAVAALNIEPLGSIFVGSIFVEQRSLNGFRIFLTEKRVPSSSIIGAATVHS
jgi:hypothetical protein